MIQHKLPSGGFIWTTYVHVAQITVQIGDIVTSDTVIGHLMNKKQLNKYGWVYNHLHFEVLRNPRIGNGGKLLSYSTWCKTKNEVMKHFYNPVDFFKREWAHER
jgi:murein DD-endopeptidase MepM/ murein hydrolase activator NlpD